MVIKKQTIYYILSILIILTSTFSYGFHVYNDYYKYFQMVISCLILLTSFIFLTYETDLKKEVNRIFSKQFYLLIVFLFMIGNTIIGYFMYHYNNLISVVNSVLIVICAIFEFYMLPAICNKYKKIEKNICNTFIYLCFAFSIVSVLIKLGNGSFLSYGLVQVRNASIFYDPNFAAMILGTGFILNIKNNFIKNKLLKISFGLVIGFAVFLTGSRGTLLAVMAAIFLYIFIYKKMKFSRRLLLVIFFIIIAFCGMQFLNSIDFFRTYQGSNKRFEMWTFTINHILKNPITGYGYQSVATFLHKNYFTNASTHNSYVDYAFAYGIPSFILFIYLIISTLFSALKNKNEENDKYIMTTLFAIINANTILYSFGGVGISSFLFTFFLGLLNYKLKSSEWGEKNEEN